DDGWGGGAGEVGGVDWREGGGDDRGVGGREGGKKYRATRDAGVVGGVGVDAGAGRGGAGDHSTACWPRRAVKQENREQRIRIRMVGSRRNARRPCAPSPNVRILCSLFSVLYSFFRRTLASWDGSPSPARPVPSHTRSTHPAASSSRGRTPPPRSSDRRFPSRASAPPP